MPIPSLLQARIVVLCTLQVDLPGNNWSIAIAVLDTYSAPTILTLQETAVPAYAPERSPSQDYRATLKPLAGL